MHTLAASAQRAFQRAAAAKRDSSKTMPSQDLAMAVQIKPSSKSDLLKNLRWLYINK